MTSQEFIYKLLRTSGACGALASISLRAGNEKISTRLDGSRYAIERIIFEVEDAQKENSMYWIRYVIREVNVWLRFMDHQGRKSDEIKAQIRVMKSIIRRLEREEEI